MLSEFNSYLPIHSGGPVPKPAGLNMPNEVEIVVTSKTNPLRQYAERIESRIRAQGLAVDVLFPREDIPIRQVLADLSSRGTLYGIVLSPLNQEHGSITLNILFGQPEGKSAKFLSPSSGGRISKALFDVFSFQKSIFYSMARAKFTEST